VLERLGSGGMAVVYRAWHLMLEKEVALKFIREEAAQSIRFRERFFREARIACELRHKHIVQALEFGETVDGQFYLLMDYCQGRTLVEVLGEEGPRPAEFVAEVGAQVLDALAEAHARSVIHRDVKPSNIMIDQEGRARLLDFGLAKSLDPEASETTARIGTLLGTPEYMSPEQAEGKAVDSLSDIYSLGGVLYELLCGKLPFEGGAVDQMRQRIAATPPPPSERVPDVEASPGLEQVLMKALSRDRESRWQSAERFRDALLRLLEGGDVDAHVPVSAEAFSLRGSVELKDLEDVQVHRVLHRNTGQEGLLWLADYGSEAAEGLERQLDVLQRIEDPALAPALEAGPYSGGRLYVFTAWTEGLDLREVIGQGPLATARTAQLAHPILEALAKAHGFGVSHEVIDPRLITLGEDGPVLHGLGVVSALRGEKPIPARDVRRAGTLILELLGGALSESAGATAAREAGLERAGRAKGVLSRACGLEGYPNAGAFLAALSKVDSRFGGLDAPPGRMAGIVAGTLMALLVVLALAFGLKGAGALKVHAHAGARVELKGLDDLDDVSRSAICDEEGLTVVGDLPPGNYNVWVTRGAEVLAAVAEVQANSTTLVSIGTDGSVTTTTADPQPGAEGAENAPVSPEDRAGFARTIKRTSDEARAFRDRARTALGDVTVPDAYGAAEAKYLRAEQFSREGSETREALLATVLAWEQARTAFEDVSKRAGKANPRDAVQGARAECVAAEAPRLAKRELAAADAAWERSKGLQGTEGLQAARVARERYQKVTQLAQGRGELVELVLRVRKAARATGKWRDLARRNMADVHDSEAFEAAKSRLGRLARRTKAAPQPGSTALDDLEKASGVLTTLAKAWTRARDEWREIAEGSQDINTVNALVAKLSGAIVREDLSAVTALYQDAGKDRYAWETLFERAQRIRFRAARPTFSDGSAVADVVEFSYEDDERKRKTLASYRVRLVKAKDTWRILSVRQER
jgi:serine/threonine-protein kinase